MELKQALQELANKIKAEILKRMSSPVGINPRTGKNTLVNSNLFHSVDVTAKDDENIVFAIADYYEFVVAGWRRTGNFPRNNVTIH